MKNSYKSICDENLSGRYSVVTNFTDQDLIEREFEGVMTLTAVKNQHYRFSDLSFGIFTTKSATLR